MSAFYFPNIQGPLETIGLTGDGPLPRFFEVASWGVNKPVEENKKAYIDAILKRYEGYRPNVTDEGLYFYGHLNKNGLYLSKNDTEFPEEKSLRFLYIFRNDSHFSGQCDVNTYVNGAALIYRFDPKIVPMSEWLALDRRLRRLVQRLMIDPEQTPLSDG